HFLSFLYSLHHLHILSFTTRRSSDLDKFIQYLPLYRQVKEWERYGLMTNDKNLSNWVIRAAEDWLLHIYKYMKEQLVKRTILHVDRKSTRLNSSHVSISYAVFCLKKK